MDRSRIGLIHADPSSATPAEIKSLAEAAYEFHRTRGTKTLRDEFAMAALTGVVSVHGVGLDPADVAEDAYAVADAMLEARGK